MIGRTGFMGAEFGQTAEWGHDRSLDWHLLGDERHAGVSALVAALNALQADRPALWQRDYRPDGFRWLDASDRAASVLAFNRVADHDLVVCIANLTPVPRPGYRVGLVDEGPWQELLSTDEVRFGGSGIINAALVVEPTPWHGQAYSAVVTLPPLGVVFIGLGPGEGSLASGSVGRR